MERGTRKMNSKEIVEEIVSARVEKSPWKEDRKLYQAPNKFLIPSLGGVYKYMFLKEA